MGSHQYTTSSNSTTLESNKSDLGKDFRERERIKRMTARWVNRLQTMPILQRQALQAALAQVDNGVGLYRQG
jgi:hypothetical protein